MGVVKFKVRDQWLSISNIDSFYLALETLTLYGDLNGEKYFVGQIVNVTEAEWEE